jgi:hypothetical protein
MLGVRDDGRQVVEHDFIAGPIWHDLRRCGHGYRPPVRSEQLIAYAHLPHRGPAGRDVGTTAAARSYFDTVLPAVPQPLSTRADADAARLDAAPDTADDVAAADLAAGD